MTKVESAPRPRWLSLFLTGLIGPPALAFTYSILFYSVIQSVDIDANRGLLSFFFPLLGLFLIAFLVAGTWLTRTLAGRIAFVLIAGTVSVVTFVLVAAVVGSARPP